jgi:hypothetical protein
MGVLRVAIVDGDMDPALNPYQAGAGLQPAELAGRDTEQEQLRTAIRRLGAGRGTNPMLLVGLRGVGKTVLLNRYRAIAVNDAGWYSAAIEASSARSLRDELAHQLETPLRELARRGVSERIRRVGASLARFKIGIGLGASAPEVTAEVEFADEETQYTGELGQDLISLFKDVGGALEDTDAGVVVTIDELHTLDIADLDALIRGLHFVGQNPSPILVVGAALPNIYARLAEAPSYAERMFQVQRIEGLTRDAARTALVAPARQLAPSVVYTTAARDTILAATGLYPYFIQMYGKHAWDTAAKSPINLKDAERAIVSGRAEMDGAFFQFRMAKGGAAARRALALLASAGDGPHDQPTLDALGVASEEIEQLKDRGLLYAISDDEIDFTTPMFGEYLRRRHPVTA